MREPRNLCEVFPKRWAYDVNQPWDFAFLVGLSAESGSEGSGAKSNALEAACRSW